MTTIYILRASNNTTFRWTRDLTAFAAVYDLTTATIRMHARMSPLDPDPPAYQWVTGAGSGGVVTFDPATNLCVFAAPEADMAALSGAMAFDCRLELPGGESVLLFSGTLIFAQGVTRLSADASSETGISGIGDTVTVDGERSPAPVPLPVSLTAAIAAAQVAAAQALAAISLIYGPTLTLDLAAPGFALN